ncbi:hypothetical protein [Pontibacter qinzhouensis]|nr:hypothetical protein [Pontibacter qinzhouensis]
MSKTEKNPKKEKPVKVKKPTDDKEQPVTVQSDPPAGKDRPSKP